MVAMARRLHSSPHVPPRRPLIAVRSGGRQPHGADAAWLPITNGCAGIFIRGRRRLRHARSSRHAADAAIWWSGGRQGRW